MFRSPLCSTGLLTTGLAAILIVATGCTNDEVRQPSSPQDAAQPDVDSRTDDPDGSDRDATPADGASQPDTGPSTDTETDGGQDPDADPSLDSGCMLDKDSDSDGLSDCEERKSCTDPHDGDTDGDGLGDLEEIRYGTDPCSADTDNDGLRDARERHFGLDANRPSTYDTPQKPDPERWFVQHCQEGHPGDKPEPVTFHEESAGNWKVALPPTFQYSALDVPDFQRPEAAAVFGQPSLEIAGALIARQMPPQQTSPTDALESGSGPVDQVIRGLAHETTDNSAGGAFTTHNYKQAAINFYEVDLGEDNKLSPRAFRDQLLRALTPHSITGGLPTSEGKLYQEYRIQVSVTQRFHAGGERTNLIALGVAPLDRFNEQDLVEFRLQGMTDTTNVADASATTRTICVLQKPPPKKPRADFYWVLDQSGSMNSENAKIKAFSSPFAEIADNTMLDYQHGISNMSGDNAGKLPVQYGGPGWHDDSGLFSSTIGTYVTECHDKAPTGWGCVGELGIEMATRGLNFMQNSPQATADEELRSNTTVYTIFMTDERAQGAWQSHRAILIDRSTVYALTVLNEERPGCHAYDGFEPLGRYRDVAKESGGRFAELCTANLEQFLEDMLHDANLDTSPFTLTQTPVSHSLRVYVDNDWVPRSTDDGFDYSATANAVGFFGDYRPSFGVPNGVQPHWVGISYWSYRDRCKDTRSQPEVNTCLPPTDEE